MVGIHITVEWLVFAWTEACLVVNQSGVAGYIVHEIKSKPKMNDKVRLFGIGGRFGVEDICRKRICIYGPR